MQNKLAVVFALGLGLGVGCAAGTAVQTSTANAQTAAPGGVTRWEYKCGELASMRSEKLNSALVVVGADGWEWAGEMSFHGDTTNVCFKRPLP